MLYEVITDSFIQYHNKPGTKENSFTSMDQDNRGDFWLTTIGNGIYHFDQNTGIFTHFKDLLSDSESVSIKKLLIDSDNTFWIGSATDGLSTFNPDDRSFYHYPSYNFV